MAAARQEARTTSLRVRERSAADRACQILGKIFVAAMQTVESSGPCPRLFNTEQDTEGAAR